jgi:hypothetical protein
MPMPEEYSREERRIRLVRRAAVGVALPVLALALYGRFYPERLSRIIPLPERPVESAELTPARERPAASRGTPLHTTSVSALAPELAAQQVQDTARTTTQTGDTAGAQDNNPASPSRRRRPITDVVLLPCTTANPRPDGSFVIPPHNPKHRTIVGLPSAPGEPRRGFVVPPHDPAHENRVPIQVISMDSILAQSLQVPPHDPRTFNVVRPYAVPCMDDSTAR